MDVSYSFYFEVVTGDNEVVLVTSKPEEAVDALPVGGVINEVVKFVASADDLTATLTVKKTVK